MIQAVAASTGSWVATLPTLSVGTSLTRLEPPSPSSDEGRGQGEGRLWVFDKRFHFGNFFWHRWLGPDHHQFSAPPVWYSVTRVSKKFFSLPRSIVSLIHGKGFFEPNVGWRPIRSKRRSATCWTYSRNRSALRPRMPRGRQSRA